MVERANFIPRSYFTPPTHRRLPGAEALTRQSELPPDIRNKAIDILKFRDAMIGAQENLCNEKKTEHVTTGGVPFAVFSTEIEICKTSASEMATHLWEKYGVGIHIIYDTAHINPVSSTRDNRVVNLSVGVLSQMAQDPEKYEWVTQQIENWLSGKNEFVGKVGNSCSEFGMSITEAGWLYWCNESENATAAQRSAVRAAMSEFMQTVMDLADNHKWGKNMDIETELMRIVKERSERMREAASDDNAKSKPAVEDEDTEEEYSGAF